LIWTWGITRCWNGVCSNERQNILPRSAKNAKEISSPPQITIVRLLMAHWQNHRQGASSPGISFDRRRRCCLSYLAHWQKNMAGDNSACTIIIVVWFLDPFFPVIKRLFAARLFRESSGSEIIPDLSPLIHSRHASGCRAFYLDTCRHSSLHHEIICTGLVPVSQQRSELVQQRRSRKRASLRERHDGHIYFQISHLIRELHDSCCIYSTGPQLSIKYATIKQPGSEEA